MGIRRGMVEDFDQYHGRGDATVPPSEEGDHPSMSTQPVGDLDATVTDGGDVLVPADEVSRVVDVEPGDHLRIRILGRTHRRRNMYGIFADDPIGISDGDLGEVRGDMWRDFGSGNWG